MELNLNFGKIENGVFTYAPRDVEYGHRTIINCTDEDIYYALGYRDVVEDKEERVGVTAVFDHAEQEEDQYEEHEDPETHEKWQELVYRGKDIRHYRYEPIVAPPAPVYRYSKLKLIVAAKEAGKWTDLKEFIADADMMDEWSACQFLASDYPQFEAAKSAIVAAGIATAEEIEAILAASVDEEA